MNSVGIIEGCTVNGNEPTGSIIIGQMADDRNSIRLIAACVINFDEINCVRVRGGIDLFEKCRLGGRSVFLRRWLGFGGVLLNLLVVLMAVVVCVFLACLMVSCLVIKNFLMYLSESIVRKFILYWNKYDYESNNFHNEKT